ncbi:hypothetical protein F4823DRAFT_564624 [Ustulina deusta]|nr:hypothetical protein F4823DRAFT_564624 [Ustulina deusta]
MMVRRDAEWRREVSRRTRRPNTELRSDACEPDEKLYVIGAILFAAHTAYMSVGRHQIAAPQGWNRESCDR